MKHKKDNVVVIYAAHYYYHYYYYYYYYYYHYYYFIIIKVELPVISESIKDKSTFPNTVYISVVQHSAQHTPSCNTSGRHAIRVQLAITLAKC